MRILVVGAGAIGGYFGGRLLEAGRDVTFLVRPKRAALLAKIGLVIKSRFGDVNLPTPPTVTADALRTPFDLILLSCKSYDLQSAADSFAPAVGPNTAILPLLNGMAHIDYLAERFGGAAVLGGQCVISVTLDADGHILHLNDTHGVSFGERDGAVTPRAEAIATTFAGARFDSRLSQAILQEMWEKWVLIATMAASNCLMRAPVGDIVAAGAENYSLALLAECAGIATAQGFAERSDHDAQSYHVDDKRLGLRRLDAARHRARRADRRRPHRRRPDPARRRSGRRSVAADRACAFAGLRGAAKARECGGGLKPQQSDMEA
jgi:2-dehydropantoate 2-reductase